MATNKVHIPVDTMVLRPNPKVGCSCPNCPTSGRALLQKGGSMSSVRPKGSHTILPHFETRSPSKLRPAFLASLGTRTNAKPLQTKCWSLELLTIHAVQSRCGGRAMYPPYNTGLAPKGPLVPHPLSTFITREPVCKASGPDGAPWALRDPAGTEHSKQFMVATLLIQRYTLFLRSGTPHSPKSCVGLEVHAPKPLGSHHPLWLE